MLPLVIWLIKSLGFRLDFVTWPVIAKVKQTHSFASSVCVFDPALILFFNGSDFTYLLCTSFLALHECVFPSGSGWEGLCVCEGAEKLPLFTETHQAVSNK